jgi:F-type H+-transporting ATPase subunit b
MGKILLTLLMVTGVASASGHGGTGETDIVQRAVNFLIFAGILYYLLADVIKGYFGGRSRAIADELEKVQEKLRDSKRAKETAELKIEEAKQFAEDLMVSAKKENKIINEKILQQCEADLENLMKQSGTLMEFEQRRMVREVVDAVMADVLAEEAAGFDREAMAQIILKKVA